MSDKSKKTISERFIEAKEGEMGEKSQFAKYMIEWMAEQATLPMVQKMEIQLEALEITRKVVLQHWEEEAFPDPHEARRKLVFAWVFQSYDMKKWPSVWARWLGRKFDQVTPEAIQIGDISVELDHRLPSIRGEGFESYRNMTVDHLLDLQWGPNMSDMNAIRPHYDGSVFVRKTSTSLEGPWVVKVPQDFPVKRAVLNGDVFMIEEPFACPSFKYQEMSFKENPWVHPLDYRYENDHVGVQVLHNSGVLVCHDKPAFYTLATKSWKCIEVMTQKGDIQLKRRGLTLARDVVTPLETAMAISHDKLKEFFPAVRTYDVICVKAGPVEVNMSVSRRAAITLLIDSAIRQEGTSYPIAKERSKLMLRGVKTMMSDTTTKMIEGTMNSGDIYFAPGRITARKDLIERSFVGSKVIVTVENDFLMIKDEMKPWDFVGGNKNLGETPIACAIREIYEETGREVKAEELVYLGYSEVTKDNEYARSFLFGMRIGNCDEWLVNDKFKRYSPNGMLSLIQQDGVQPWVFRIVAYLQSICGQLGLVVQAIVWLKGFMMGRSTNGLMPAGGGPLMRKIFETHKRLRRFHSAGYEISLRSSQHELLPKRQAVDFETNYSMKTRNKHNKLKKKEKIKEELIDSNEKEQSVSGGSDDSGDFSMMDDSISGTSDEVLSQDQKSLLAQVDDILASAMQVGSLEPVGGNSSQGFRMPSIASSPADISQDWRMRRKSSTRKD